MELIPEAEIVGRLRAESPWWDPPHQVGPQFADLAPRAYLPSFLELVRQRAIRRAVVLMGPRRVGKTVMIHHAIAQLIREGAPPEELAYIAVDLPLYNGLGLERLLMLAEQASGRSLRWVFFDEVQYLPQWEVHLKRLVDDHPDLKIVASGSAAATLKLKSQESGAGRFTDFLLPPLMFAEYLSMTGAAASPELREGAHPHVSDIVELNRAFVEYANFGGYPEAALNAEVRADPARFIKGDIIDKVLLRDIPQLHGIGDTQELNRLFTALAWNTGNEVSLDTMSKNAGVAKNTLKKYVEYLEAAYLIRVLHRVDRDATRFSRATNYKVYLTNPSLRSALFAPISAEADTMGALVETAIIAQSFHDPGPMYYAGWKERNQREVDLVTLGPTGRPASALEIKWSDRYVDAPDRLDGLVQFAQSNGLVEVAATTRTQFAERAVQGIKVRMLPAAVRAWSPQILGTY